jgi:Cu2+-containing amine oxidase
MAESGSVIWPSANEPIWRFNYSLADSPDQEGVTISQVYFRGRKVFWKASLPSLRVQYNGGCGPYKDPLHYNNAQTTSLCPSQRVCLYSYISNGYRGLQVQSYHRIGAYRLTHRWVFWEDGAIYPRLYSAGLQCNDDHRHHAYWRFDFDIGDAPNDLVLEYNTYTPNQGWGNGWHTKTNEISRLKNSSSQRSWAVLDKQSGRGYHILPGPYDGNADAFSTRDVWIVHYQSAEDKHGQQGNASSDDLQPYLNGENIDGQDVVVWYVGHLAHEAADVGDEWHHVGPYLIPFNNWDWA